MSKPSFFRLYSYEMEIPNFIYKLIQALIDLHPNPPTQWSDLPDYIKDLQILEEAIRQMNSLILTIWGTGIIQTRIAVWSVLQQIEQEKNESLTALQHKTSGGCQLKLCTKNCHFDRGNTKLTFIMSVHDIIDGLAIDKPKPQILI